MQAGFALVETVGWGRCFVEEAAGSWLTTLETTLRTEYGVTDATALTKLVDNHIGWAGNLAFNMGVYNLALAVGLAWVALAGASVARPLGGVPGDLAPHGGPGRCLDRGPGRLHRSGRTRPADARALPARIGEPCRGAGLTPRAIRLDRR